MAEIKFLKAKCSRTNRYYGLEIKKFGLKWKVVNMISLSDDEARLISSEEIKQSEFVTNENLISCIKCGNRTVGGCSCSKGNHPCEKNMDYQFDCIYCSEFKIDYSLPTESEVGGRAGTTIKLSQGQEVKIRYADNRPLSKIIVGVGWDPVNSGDNMDVDSSVIMFGSRNVCNDIIYFGNKEHESGCLLHHGDNLTGEGGIQDGDDENITVQLDKVPTNVEKLVFILNIYRSADRHQTLDDVRNLYIKLYDPISKKSLISYEIRGNTGRDTAMVIGAVYRQGREWSFKAIGRSLKADNIDQVVSKSVANGWV